MKLRKSFLAGVLVASLGGILLPLAAGAASIYLDVAPPEARYERTPAPRAGYLWTPGYWDAKNNRHVWKRGHWEHERQGYHYTHPAWTQHDNRWQLERGRWSKGDRDGDGVPNARDRAPDNPNRS